MTPTLDAALLISSREGADLGRTSVRKARHSFFKNHTTRVLHGGYTPSQYWYGTSSSQVLREKEVKGENSYLACIGGE